MARAFSRFYTEYLRSQQWGRVRRRAISLAGGKCRICGRRYSLQVHHLTYKNLGHESQWDLLVVCSRCHSIITFLSRLWRFLFRRRQP